MSWRSISLKAQPTLRGIRVTEAPKGHEELVGREWGWEHVTLRTNDSTTFASPHDDDGHRVTGPNGEWISITMIRRRRGVRISRCVYRRFLRLVGGEPFRAGVRLPPRDSAWKRGVAALVVAGLGIGIAWLIWRAWFRTVGAPGAATTIDWIVFWCAAGVLVVMGGIFAYAMWIGRRPKIPVEAVLLDECGLELIERGGRRSRHDWTAVGRLRRRSMHHAALSIEGGGRLLVPYDARFALLHELMAERWRAGDPPKPRRDRIQAAWLATLRLIACGVVLYLAFWWAISSPALAPHFAQLGQLPIGMALYCIGGPLLLGGMMIGSAYRTRASTDALKAMPRPWLASSASS